MAALVAGEKARMFALGNVARGGATRGGYTSAQVFVSIGGTHYATGRAAGQAQVDDGSLSITDLLDETPNTAQLTVRGFTPIDGQDVIVTIGSKNSLTREFGGLILSHDASYVGTPANAFYTLRCIDYSWIAKQRKVSGRYTSVSASTIAAALVPLGFTGKNIQAGLPTIDTFSYTNQDPNATLTQLARRIGAYWFWDYQKDLHFFTTDTTFYTTPLALTSAHATLTAFQVTTDLSQILTRCFVEGGGVTCLAAIGPGETILPVADVAWYPVGGGVVACPNQRLTYTAAVPSGGGTLVGPGVTPSAAPADALVIGMGLSVGLYKYAYTWVTAAGETLPSPLQTITSGLLAAPGSALTPAAPTPNGSLGTGVYQYGYTDVTAAGETVPSPLASITTGVFAPPATAPTYGGSGAGAQADGYYGYAVTYVTASGETTVGPVVQFHTLVNLAVVLNSIPTGSSAVTQRKVYRTTVQLTGAAALAAALYLLTTLADNTTTTYTDALADGSLGAAAPASNTAVTSTVALSAIAVGATGVTQRKVYRTAVGASQLKLLTTLADNTTTTFTDTIADGSLGANAPTVGTAVQQQVAVSGIGVGPATVTSRKVYRTAVGASQLKLLATLADNTTTTYADSTADGSLGANVVTSDTSGLAQPAGQVQAGLTTLLLAGAAAFSATGGWALLAGQQAVRYTGITGNTLTGIPVSGPGAIVATVTYNSTAVALACLSGIPASGAGSILFAILVGDRVNLLVQVDDLTAQANLSALLDPSNAYGGARGIQEDYLTDGTIGATEANARGLAQIALRKVIDVQIAYTCQDRNSRSGKNIVHSLPAPFAGTQATYKIQQVTQTGHTPKRLPMYTVQAGSRFSFEDLLRRVRG
jgi:hypothetical protein